MISGVVRPNRLRSRRLRRAQFDAGDDIAPLVRAAHLQTQPKRRDNSTEIVGLQDHVIEFEERQRLLALEPQPHAVHGQHAVDREMPPDIAQERDVVAVRPANRRC